ncbi:MAG: hypothetical protein GX339_02880 [Tissierellia bacterium]|nr:hypothetical protein [Tissierellia bacterium]
MKVFKKLKGFKYYCIPFEESYLDLLLKFYHENKEKILSIGKLLGYEDISEDRVFFENILPRLENILDMKGRNDYQDICLRFFERIAEKYKVERFKIYRAEDFIKIIIEKFKENPTSYIKNVPGFIKHNKILSLAVKEDLIVEIFADLFV